MNAWYQAGQESAPGRTGNLSVLHAEGREKDQMTDIVEPRTRSRMMAGIGGKNTQPELRVRRYLHGAGLRFSLHRRDLPGRPDIVLPAFGAVVLVHGCFWHRHPGCRFATNPATRKTFWEQKFRANVTRDQLVSERLEQAGWRVFTIWECETRDEITLDQLFWRLVAGGGATQNAKLGRSAGVEQLQPLFDREPSSAATREAESGLASVAETII